MNQFDQYLTPENIVANIVAPKIYLKNISSQMLETVKGMGAFPLEFRNELVWLIESSDEEHLIQVLQELNRLGFLFAGGPAGYPAADMFAFLLDRKHLSVKFKEIRWRNPSDWFIIERSGL